MTEWWQWGLAGLGALALAYLLLVGALLLAGRGGPARAVAMFVPDCIVLLRRILADPRVPRRRKALIALAIGYLATPLDLVPDFIPVAGQLDDAVIVALVLRHLLRGAPTGLVEELWPGRPESLRVVLALACGRRRSPA